MQTPLLILGPTASGKTAYAIGAAIKHNGEVVNMDSMQVYRDLSVLTARPDAQELAAAPHHMFGHIDGAETYSTGSWLADAQAAIHAIQARGRRPILVGGTGLYAHALTQGLVPTPPVPADVRAATRRAVGADTRAAHARLKQIDPEAARRIEPRDAVRIARALEVFEATGRSLSDWHKDPQPPILAPGTWEGIALMPERDVLYARIEARFEKMMETGGLEEAHRLYERGLDPDLPVMKAVGMPGLIDFFEGRIGLDQAVARSILDSRHYAKRQMTWIRNRAADWKVIPV
ncbi:tRNA dimethylallyltransferase [Candidatus Phycosocius bacilliformis]|uniref:tRNA dimethylallyltransferase n=1 Tax=Candidatus Phycosocius bacilliformis TaxID=1445552 RepID=A0A2P2ECA0_9PROT|nr:tRNA (adenosine(37)-N6)-dimethylallyltransferase MiaA [Candidatus Phycosocius bacilliformis]GBF58696.1 tRNA dimethylallyltransferase [Candidatus Phycosocius bacilliformis]